MNIDNETKQVLAELMATVFVIVINAFLLKFAWNMTIPNITDFGYMTYWQALIWSALKEFHFRVGYREEEGYEEENN